MEINSVSIVGSGNVAYHMVRALALAGIQVNEIVGRNEKAAREIVEYSNGSQFREIRTDLGQSLSTVFILAVSDDSIEEVANRLKLPDHGVLVHTSGTADIKILGSRPRTGVLYPLQTFSKGRDLDYKQLPFFIEATDKKVEEALVNLASRISNHVRILKPDQRQSLHLAAVFANNFVNHLLGSAFEVCEKSNVDPKYLKPLLVETIDKAFELRPFQAQTGPAIRGDRMTIQLHKNKLRELDISEELYSYLTLNIIERIKSEIR